ncbi:hypothetical protein ACN9MZ_00725 [Pseudoduganella sp. S-14]
MQCQRLAPGVIVDPPFRGFGIAQGSDGACGGGGILCSAPG